MLYIRGQDVYISRGDTKRLDIKLTEKIGREEVEYHIAVDEYLVFRLWDKDYTRVIKSLRSYDGETLIDIPAEFTRQMCGNEFKYSVDLMLRDGTKETVVGETPNTVPKFIILEA